MEALRNIREAIYNLIDLRSVREQPAIYDEVGPPRHLAAPFVEQGEAINEAIEAQYGRGPGGNQQEPGGNQG